MGCGASCEKASEDAASPSGKGSQQSKTGKQDAQEDPWQSLSCDPALVQQLRAAGLVYSTVCALLQLGVMEQSNLKLLTPQDVEGLQLNLVQQRLLLTLLPAGQQANTEQTQPQQPPPPPPPQQQQQQQGEGTAAAKAEVAMPPQGSHATQAKKDQQDGETSEGAHAPQAAQTPSSTHQDASEAAVDEDEHLPPRDRLKKLHKDKHKLTNLVKEGLNLGVKFLDVVGPILPVPGPSAAKLLSTIMNHCSKAMGNKTNVLKLAEKCAQLMGLLAGHLKPATTPQATKSGMEASQEYRKLMGQFKDMLVRAERYCAAYSERFWLWRIVDAPGDDKEYNALAKTLSELIAEATLAVGLDCQAIGVEIRTKIDKMAKDLEVQLAFVDCDKQLREFVKKKGGICVFKENSTLLQQASDIMDIGQQISLELFKRHVESSIIMAMDRGAHTNIKHPDLREIWYNACGTDIQVPWGTWWLIFPQRMESMLPAEEFQELCSVLESDTARAQFKEAVDRQLPDYISVDELEYKFPLDKTVLERTKEILAYVSASTGTEDLIPTGVEDTKEDTRAERSSCGAQNQHSRCMLPMIDKDMYVGRGSTAMNVCSLLTGSKGGSEPPRAVMLLGPGGLGKSTLASDIGWRMWEGGHISGGAALVNLRDAATVEQQLQRLCQTLAMPYDATARQRVLSKLTDLQQDNKLLLVLDNAEDCLSAPTFEDFASLVSDMMLASPAVLLLITSRAPWPSTEDLVQPDAYEQFTVPPVETASTKMLLRSLCPVDVLSDHQLEQVAAACKGSPMMTRLLASALEAGRLTAEEIMKDSSNEADSTSEYDIVLKALPQQYLDQLSRLTVFPHTFNEEDASAVLDSTPDQALVSLQVLHSHNLLLCDAACGQHYMHVAVKQQVIAQAEDDLMEAAQDAFVQLFMGRLLEWTELYTSPQYSLAMSRVQQHATNLRAVWQLVDSGNLSDASLEAVAEAATESMAGLLQKACLYKDTPTWGKLHAHNFKSKHHCINLAQRTADDIPRDIWQAKEMNMRVLAMCQELLGPEDPLTIKSLFGVAECLDAQGNHAAAEGIFRRTLELRQQVIGPEHPHTISSINALALCLGDMGQYNDAEPLYRNALELCQRVLGPEHPNTLSAINNLACCLDSMGQYTEAETLYRRALKQDQLVLGPEHPSTIVTINNLAYCLDKMENYTEAERLYRNALEVRQRVLGPEHPKTITSINNLAACLDHMGKYATAEQMYRTALELQLSSLGSTHPNTIASTDNLAAFLKRQEERSRA